jgi:hypothetical protein
VLVGFTAIGIVTALIVCVVAIKVQDKRKTVMTTKGRKALPLYSLGSAVEPPKGVPIYSMTSMTATGSIPPIYSSGSSDMPPLYSLNPPPSTS